MPKVSKPHLGSISSSNWYDQRVERAKNDYQHANLFSFPVHFDETSSKNNFRNIFIAPKVSSWNFRGSLFSYLWAITVISAVIANLDPFGTLVPRISTTVKMKLIHEINKISFNIIFRYEVKNEPESKMHLVRSFGVKWHKSNMIVKPFIKSDLNKQLHLSGEILKKSLLSHITAGSSWLKFVTHPSSWLNHFPSEVLHFELSFRGFLTDCPKQTAQETLISFNCCPFMFVPSY